MGGRLDSRSGDQVPILSVPCKSLQPRFPDLYNEEITLDSVEDPFQTENSVLIVSNNLLICFA